MAETYVKGASGLPFKTDEGQVEQAIQAGASAIPRQAAVEGTEAIQKIQEVEKNYGNVGAGAIGFLSGLGAGITPGLLSGMGLMDPETLLAMQGMGAYQAGDIAGMIAPTLLTGGEAAIGRGAAQAGSRGLLGIAARATPAGLIEGTGSLAERLAGKLIPETAGLMGRASSVPLKMAARGAAEGALVNMGHFIGDSMVQNKPLAAESILASGADGALFGGLIGGTVGTVGSLGKIASEAGSGGAKGIAKGEGRLGTVARRLGMSEGDVATATETGGLREKLKSYRSVLDSDGQGVNYSSRTSDIRDSAGRTRRVAEAGAKGIIETLDKQVGAPAGVAERVAERLDTQVLERYRGTILEREAGKVVDALSKDLGPAAEGSWSKWMATRDALAERAANPGLSGKVSKETLAVLDNELRQAMEAAEAKIGETGLADKFAATQATIATAKELEAAVGKKAASELLAHETNFTPRDLAVMGGMAAVGSPGTALGWMAAKGLGRYLNRRLEPAMAEYLYKSSIGQRAAAAEDQAKFRVRESLSKFFRTPSKGLYAAKAQGQLKPQKYDRKSYEDAVTRTEQLLSQNHQQRISKVLETLQSMGYQQYAGALAAANLRANQYLAANMPARKGTMSLGSLRPQPKIHGLDMNEFKSLRILSGVTKPFDVLDHMNDGTVSRDEVRAMKYVYPELHTQIVQESAQQIYEMKSQGEFLPMDKIATLGIVLDSPIDSTLTPEFISAVQRTFQPVPLPEPQQPPQVATTMPMSQDIAQSGLLPPSIQSVA